MSARAAARLAALGFNRVYDYVGGKKNWLAAGLPVEGERAGELHSGDLTRRSPPTCRPGGTIASIDGAEVESWGLCVVTGVDDVVLGLVTPGDLAGSSHAARLDEIMQPGPTTIRPSRSVKSSRDLIDQLEVDFVLVTTELGELLGVLYREDVDVQAG